MLFSVYVVDDDPNFRDWLGGFLEAEGLRVSLFAGGDAFLAAIDALPPGCVVLDMRAGRRTGLKVQAELIARGRALPVIATTGYSDVDTAVAAMKLGAIEFLEKPFAPEALLDALARGFRQLEAPGA